MEIETVRESVQQTPRDVPDAQSFVQTPEVAPTTNKEASPEVKVVFNEDVTKNEEIRGNPEAEPAIAAEADQQDEPAVELVEADAQAEEQVQEQVLDHVYEEALARVSEQAAEQESAEAQQVVEEKEPEE